ncbi:sensor histidine kinase [Treponema zioleckii]|uniref:sensor histidine kinase n=1 Tax=Treponema zioleckii TaxID=331680 RepID=UPI00168B384E|nr:sensor histidine kinase [Treponema zioleckii]
MKKFSTFLLFAALTFSGFCHTAQKQTEKILPEELTQKWQECESAAESDFESRFEDFYEEVKKAEPTDTVVYYFPEAKEIYQNIRSGIDERDRQKISENVHRWEILQKNLVKFQLEQFYYSYRLLLFVIIFTVSTSLVFFILYLFTSKSRKESRAFATQMIKTQESERERISNELHDTVCQDLRVLQFRLEDEESITICKKIASDVRNTCYALTPSDLNEGIFEALISLCALLKKQSGIKIILSIQEELKNDRTFKTFAKDKNLNLYRIVQEILTNAIKHAEAESITVLIRTFDEKNFKIIVSDDGKGFDLKSALKKKNHFGLKNIITRVENIQGEISFNSEKDEGTQVTIIVPF